MGIEGKVMMSFLDIYYYSEGGQLNHPCLLLASGRKIDYNVNRWRKNRYIHKYRKDSSRSVGKNSDVGI